MHNQGKDRGSSPGLIFRKVFALRQSAEKQWRAAVGEDNFLTIGCLPECSFPEIDFPPDMQGKLTGHM
jgi:hypothetical protein